MVPLVGVRYDGLIASYLGETAARLRKVFEYVRTRRCVLFFDEFDMLGKERGDRHETDEIQSRYRSVAERRVMKTVSMLASMVVVALAGRLSADGTISEREDRIRVEVAVQYCDYTADPEATLIRLRSLSQDRKWRELIQQFEHEDFAAWPPELARQASEAMYLRGQAHAFLKNGKQAEADLKAAVTLNPRNDLAWLSRGDNYSSNLHDDQQALAAYREVLKLTGRSNGWLPISTTLAIARILTDQVKTDEALEVLQQYGEMEGMAPIWRIKMLRAYGHVYAAQGQETESLAKFREALEVESRQ